MMMTVMMRIMPSGGDVVGSGECFSAGILSALCIIYNYCEFSYNYAWAHIFSISTLLNFPAQLPIFWAFLLLLLLPPTSYLFKRQKFFLPTKKRL